MTLQRRHRTRNYILGGLLTLVLAVVVIVHTYLAGWLLNYVNDVLHHIKGYEGSVQSIDIDLYRGAYRLNRLVINKKEGKIPVPFVAIRTADLSIQWGALLHGRIVSDAVLTGPVINFAVNKSAVQAGDDVDWTKPIRKLMPIDINHVRFADGKITYRDFSSTPNVDIYMHHMHGEVNNLRNVVNKANPLPSTLDIQGDSIGNGSLRIKGRMNILKQVPDMDLVTELENVHLPALSNYSDAYGGFDFKDGDFDLYSEFIVKDKRVTGYVKPVARHIAIIDLRKTSNPIKIVWESVVSAVIDIFTNQKHDQFATKIPLEGNLDNIQTDSWATIGGIFHNAFVAALKKGLDYSNDEGTTHSK
ncbi:MAG TPA: DUF748 domain-containing protein [Rickettsiales bacterium]|nr:DUF748 domain-containing protein [Rickettsiales bacterium]